MTAGRPKGSTTASAAARKGAILAAAATVFANKGYEGASTRLLAQEAGVNIGTLAYHFGDKEGLYVAVIEQLYGQMITMPVPDLSGLSAELRVRTVVSHVFQFALKNRDTIRVLLRHVMEHGRLPEAVRKRWELPTLKKLLELEVAMDIGPLAEHSLALLSMNHLLARYAVTDPREWRPLVQNTSPTDAISEHLGDVAVRLLLHDSGRAN